MGNPNATVVVTTSTMLAVSLRSLAGGSFHDIVYDYGISVSSFYEYIWTVVDAIIEELKHVASFPYTDNGNMKGISDEFESASSCGLFDRCVGALDGWIVKIKRPNVPKANRFWYCQCLGHC